MSKLRLLVACEFSGIVRDAFLERGHDAWSCDLLPTESVIPYRHYQGDVYSVMNTGCWDLMIAHPPCTFLAVSGARWFKDRRQEQENALRFVRGLMDADIPRIAIENPISVISSRIRKPDEIVQPWWFGHPETKSTCLWLKNLPNLTPTSIYERDYEAYPKTGGFNPRVHHESPGPNRWKNRSRTMRGFAEAMADQWGSL